MSSLRKTLTAIAGLVVLLVATPLAFSQDSELYGGWGGSQVNSRNIPAGTVVDPGSQLIYIVDVGLNLRQQAREESGDDTKSDLNDSKWLNPINSPEIAADRFDASGDPLPGEFAQNFLTITNTHPTQAVTIHFRYFNDECQDILDFLVVLTCNDTLIFDPFNFEIPGEDANTKSRMFGPAEDIFTPIFGKAWASGRFLIFATASGASLDSDDNAEFRYPYDPSEALPDVNHHCDSLQTNTYFGKKDPFVSSNLIHGDNLHVFNAAAVAFNYLIGSQVYAQLISESGEVPISQAYSLNAWIRPAVNLGGDQLAEETGHENMYSELGLEKLSGSPNDRDDRRHPDGDGAPLLAGNDFRILTGGERVKQSDQTTESLVDQNTLYLRNDVHGGDTGRIGVPINASLGVANFSVWWGALGTSIFGMGFDEETQNQQVINLLSIMDDYNGSGEGFGFGIDDSYNIGPARTTYVLQIFDHEENLYDFTVTDPKRNISPPLICPDCIPAPLKIIVDCLRVWVGDVIVPQASVEDLSIYDLQKLTLEGGGPLAHLSANVPPLSDVGDLSAGWIRFVRDNTEDGTWQQFTFDPGDADTPPNGIGSSL